MSVEQEAGVTKEFKEGFMLGRNLIQKPLRNYLGFTTEETTESRERFASVRKRAFITKIIEGEVISLTYRNRRRKES
jgi:hypothetical protein